LVKVEGGFLMLFIILFAVERLSEILVSKSARI
jgi:hypothetical protein